MISFVIVNYRSSHILKKCINSINFNIGNLEHEIIIVNNDDNELTAFNETARSKVVNVGYNSGFSKACNLGAQSARGDILFFINPDCELVSEVPAGIFSLLSENGGTGAIAPILISQNGDEERWCYGKFPSLSRLLLNNLSFHSTITTVKDSPFETDWVSGAALLIKKDFFVSLGGFDEGFFMYFEDVDLCRRIQKTGLKVKIYPMFKVLHRGGSSFDSKKEQKRLYFESQEKYFAKNYGFFSVMILRFMRLFHG